RALELWPDLRELWQGIEHREYCRRMQASLRGWALHGGPRNLVALRLDEYLPWCEQHDRAPAEARAAYAADMASLRRCQRWPPRPPPGRDRSSPGACPPARACGPGCPRTPAWRASPAGESVHRGGGAAGMAGRLPLTGPPDARR